MTDDQAIQTDADIADNIESNETESEALAVAHAFPGYRVIRTLCEDGSCVYYKAEETRSKRTVAIGVFYTDSYATSETLKRFEREIESLRHLNHRGLATLLDVGSTKDGGYYLISEYVRGVSLPEYVRSQKPVFKERIDIFFKLCEAVQFIHQHCVLHRDISPNNVMINGKGNVKLLGLGVATLANHDLSPTNSKGEKRTDLAYRSPEQIRGKTQEIDVRTDIYSLGAVLYELLTGKALFDAESLDTNELRRRICEETIKISGNQFPYLRGDMQSIILKALDKSPHCRYDNVAAFVSDVQNFLVRRPVKARQVNTFYRFKMLVARNAVKTAVAALVGLGIAAFGAKKYVSDLALAQQLAIQARKQAEYRLKQVQNESQTALQQHQAVQQEVVKERTQREEIARNLAQMETRMKQAESSQHDMEERMTVAKADVDIARKSAWFFADLCKQTQVAKSPHAGLGLLDQAVARVGSNFTDKPILQAAILHQAGVGFVSLRQYGKAYTALTAALEKLQAERGEANEYTIGTMNDLASVLYAQGKPAEAETFSRKIADLSAKAFGDDDSRTITSVNNLGLALKAQERFSEAEPLLSRALTGRRKLLGEDHLKTVAAKRNLASVMMIQKHEVEAEPLLRDVLTAYEKTTPTPAWTKWVAQAELGDCLARLEKFEEAEKLLLAAYDQLQSSPADHTFRVKVLQNVISLYENWGKAEEETKWCAKLSKPATGKGSDEMMPEPMEAGHH